MSSHSQYLALRRFGSLDGLRAISVLAVIWHHTAPSWVSGPLKHAGAEGVTLFFAISGFLITTLLLREHERHGVIDLRAFYIRRALRIFPLYYGTLLVYAAAVTLLERHSPAGQAFFQHLPYFASFTSNLFVERDERVIFFFAWSVAAEEQFYMLWPPALVLIGAAAPRALFALAALVVACVGASLLGSAALSKVPLAIVLGAALAVALHTRKGFEVLSPVLGQRWSSAAALAAAVAALGSGAYHDLIVALLCVAVVGASSIQYQHGLAGLLGVKGLAYVGSISYGVYMLHMLCKNLVEKSLGSLGLLAGGLEVFALTVLLAVGVATLSFRYFESFFLKLKKSHERLAADDPRAAVLRPSAAAFAGPGWGMPAPHSPSAHLHAAPAPTRATRQGDLAEHE